MMPKKVSTKKNARNRALRRGVTTFGQDRGPQGNSVLVPPRNYLQSTIAGVAPSIRRTLAWSVGASVAMGGYLEHAIVLLNSPFDPDAALGGVSATGFAKYMALYSKCFVLAARAKVKYAVAGAAGGTPVQPSTVGAVITTNSVSLGTVTAAINAGLVDYHVLNQHPDSGVLNLSVDVSKFVDKPIILDDPQFFCTAAANPAQIIALHLFSADFAGVNSISFQVEVEYDCVFTDPIPFT